MAEETQIVETPVVEEVVVEAPTEEVAVEAPVETPIDTSLIEAGHMPVDKAEEVAEVAEEKFPLRKHLLRMPPREK